MDLVIVSGHSSGFGAAFWQQAQALGWARLGISRREVAVSEPWTLSVQIDLASMLEWELQLDQALEAWGEVTWSRIFLVTSAAQLGPVATAEACSASELLKAYQLNVLAPLRLMAWAERRWPKTPLKIATLSSGAATKAYRGWLAYCGTKAALRASTQVFAAEAEAKGLNRRYLSYAPGVLDTPMQAEVRSSDPEVFPDRPRFLALSAQQKLVSPEASARALWQLLLSDQAAAFTEQRYEDA